MNWLRNTLLKKFHGVEEENRAAIENSQALLEEIERTDPHIDAQHEKAVTLLQQATERAKRLKRMDAENHYSESLTYSMRGNPA